MTLHVWMLFCVTETILCFTPGPAVLLVVSQALTRGASAGFRASIGILSANAFYFLLSATGIGAMSLASWKLFFLIKWIGAAYLIWLGLGMILSPSRGLAHDAGPDSDDRRSLAPFRHGIVTQGTKPSLLVYFSAFLPQFIDPRSGVPGQVVVLALSSILIELAVLSIYVAICHRARGLVRRPGFATSLDRAGGALLIAAGAGMAMIRRS